MAAVDRETAIDELRQPMKDLIAELISSFPQDLYLYRS